MPTICHLAGLKVRTPIMIDWSDLGRKRRLPISAGPLPAMN